MECLCYGIKHWLVKNKKFFKITKQNRFNIEIHFIQACERRKGRSHRGCFSRIKRHLYDFWNVVDLLSYGLLITALTIRHLIGNETHVFARNVFALSLLVMYLRFLEVFLIYRILGPTLMMIKEMVFFFINKCHQNLNINCIPHIKINNDPLFSWKIYWYSCWLLFLWFWELEYITMQTYGRTIKQCGRVVLLIGVFGKSYTILTGSFTGNLIWMFLAVMKNMFLFKFKNV